MSLVLTTWTSFHYVMLRYIVMLHYVTLYYITLRTPSDAALRKNVQEEEDEEAEIDASFVVIYFGLLLHLLSFPYSL
jgi:hypothetical protein